MATKKKTTKTKTPKRSASWQTYFQAAIIGLTTATPDLADGTDDDDTDVEITQHASLMVRRAEKIADIATARNG